MVHGVDAPTATWSKWFVPHVTNLIVMHDPMRTWFDDFMLWCTALCAQIAAQSVTCGLCSAFLICAAVVGRRTMSWAPYPRQSCH